MVNGIILNQVHFQILSAVVEKNPDYMIRSHKFHSSWAINSTWNQIWLHIWLRAQRLILYIFCTRVPLLLRLFFKQSDIILIIAFLSSSNIMLPRYRTKTFTICRLIPPEQWMVVFHDSCHLLRRFRNCIIFSKVHLYSFYSSPSSWRCSSLDIFNGYIISLDLPPSQKVLAFEVIQSFQVRLQATIWVWL